MRSPHSVLLCPACWPPCLFIANRRSRIGNGQRGAPGWREAACKGSIDVSGALVILERGVKEVTW